MLSSQNMSTNMEKLTRDKLSILNFVNLNGPSLSIKIAKAIESSPLFTSAFLSELYGEQKLKMSHMKVGSSHLYYLPNQEEMLEKFSEYLNEREKQALIKIKESKILKDSELTPVMRVAINSIKDFAIPVKVRIKDETNLFWRYFLLKEEETKSLIQKHLSISSKEKSPTVELKKEIPKIQETEEEKDKILKKMPDKIEKQIIHKEKAQKQESITKENLQILEKTKKQKKVISLKFPNFIKEYLEAKEIEILLEIEQKKKEFLAKIRIDTLFGKQSFFLLAKDKKKITENDLTLALQKAQTEKMPAIIMSPGNLDKKAQTYLKEYQNLIKFEQVNL